MFVSRKIQHCQDVCSYKLSDRVTAVLPKTPASFSVVIKHLILKQVWKAEVIEQTSLFVREGRTHNATFLTDSVTTGARQRGVATRIDTCMSRIE